MIRIFKLPKIFLAVSIPIWAVVVAFARLFVFTEFDSTLTGVLYPVLFFVTGAYILFSLATVAANKMHKSYNEILSQSCDAELFVALYGEIREKGKEHASTVYITETAYATGIHLVGRSEEAREIVRALKDRPDFDKQRAVDRADVYIDIGIYSVALGDDEAAREAIGSAEEILGTLPVGGPDYSRIYREVTRLRHRADIAIGKFDEAREYFADTTREYTVPYTKVNRMYTMAQIYRATGEIRSLHKCLSYVAENGGTMKMAKDAREELATLPELPPEPAYDDED